MTDQKHKTTMAKINAYMPSEEGWWLRPSEKHWPSRHEAVLVKFDEWGPYLTAGTGKHRIHRGMGPWTGPIPEPSREIDK
jgi:hypothetical protein